MSLYFGQNYKIPIINQVYSTSSPIMSTVSSPIYSPYVKQIVSPYGTPQIVSPYGTPVVTPVSKVTVGPYSTTVTTTNMLSYQNPYPQYLIEPYNDLNNGYLAQKQMVDHMLWLVLDEWLYDDLCHILKYFKITDGKVHYIETVDGYKNNKICEDSQHDVELKADFIEENILGKEEMRNLLKKMIDELGYNWTEFPLRKGVVMDTVERYLKYNIKKNIEKRQN